MVVGVRAQILSFVEDAAAWDMMSFETQDGVLRAQSWGPQGFVECSFNNFVELVQFSRISRSIFVTFDWRAAGPYREGLSAVIGEFRLSPTHQQWELPPRPTDHSRALYSDHEARRSGLAWNRVREYPTFAEARIEIGSVRGGRATDLVELVGARWPALRVAGKGVTAYLDLIDEEAKYAPNVIEELAGWPGTYSQLRNRFASLHDVLVGPAGLCREVLDRLECDERVDYGVLGDQGQSFVRVPRACRGASSDRGLAQVLVERDEINKPVELEVGLGEYKSGSRVLFSVRRLAALRAEGKLPGLPPGFVYAPLVRDEHAQLAGINPLDVPASLFQEPALALLRSSVDAELLALAPSLPVRHRIWIAYRTALQQPLSRRLEECRLVHSLFFSDLDGCD